MAERNKDYVETLGRKKVHLTGKFAVNGTSAPTGVAGTGFTVARTGVGQFTVTFANAYGNPLYAAAELVQASDRRIKACVDSVDGPTTHNMVITLFNYSTNAAVDEAASGGRVVGFCCDMDDALVA